MSDEAKTEGAEIIDWTAHEREFVGWAIIEMLTDYEQRMGERLCGTGIIDTKRVPVEVRIAGRRMSFASMMRRIDEQLDRMVAQRAAELIEKKCGEIDAALDDIGRMVRERLELPAREE